MAKILVLDEEEVVLRLVAEVLKRAHHEVLTARNGLEAAVRFRACGGAIDAVIADVTPPPMSGSVRLSGEGRQFVRLIRGCAPAIKVVSMSGCTELDPEGAAFLRKPFTPAELRACLEEILGDSATGHGELRWPA